MSRATKKTHKKSDGSVSKKRKESSSNKKKKPSRKRRSKKDSNDHRVCTRVRIYTFLPDGKIVIAPVSPGEYRAMKAQVGERPDGLEDYEWHE